MKKTLRQNDETVKKTIKNDFQATFHHQRFVLLIAADVLQSG